MTDPDDSGEWSQGVLSALPGRTGVRRQQAILGEARILSSICDNLCKVMFLGNTQGMWKIAMGTGLALGLGTAKA